MGYEALDQALNRLEQVFFNQVSENAKLDEQNKAQLLTQLLSMEIESQKRDELFLQEEGVKLSPEFGTPGYSEIADLIQSNQLNYNEALSSLVSSAEERSDYYSDARTTYNRGTQESRQLDKLGATTQDYYEGSVTSPQMLNSLNPAPIDEYIYSPDEISLLINKGDISGEDAVDSIYMQGFYAGGRNQEDALAMMQIDTQLQGNMLKLQQGKIELAEQGNAKTINSIGTVITNNMMNNGIPILGLQGRLAIEGGPAYYEDKIEQIISAAPGSANSGSYSNVLNELVSSLNIYAEGGINPHSGFVKMAANASKIFLEVDKFEKTAILQGIFAEGTTMLTEEHREFLMAQNPEYKAAYELLIEYSNVGIPIGNQKLLQQASVSSQLDSNIIDATHKIVTENVGQTAQQLGIDPGAIMSSLDYINQDSFSNMQDFVVAENYNKVPDDGPQNNLGLVIPDDLEAATKQYEEISSKRNQQTNLLSGSQGGIDQNYSISGINRSFRSIPSINRLMSEIDEGGTGTFIPSEKELNEIKGLLEKEIKRAIDPESRATLSQRPFLNLIGSLPGTSLIVELAGGIPSQGIYGAAAAVPYVKEINEEWKRYISMVNQYRSLQGEKEIKIGQLTNILGGI